MAKRATRTLPPEVVAKSRVERLIKGLALRKGDLAQRLSETRKLFGRPLVLFDPHTHSHHSDGSATVAENHAAAMHAGLDFLFATDHYSLGQKRALRRLPNVSWGQETGGKGHHIGLLCNRRLFRPLGDSLAADFARARKLAPFVWVPHPAGWYPKRVYSLEKQQQLETLGQAFAMEVINGAHKIDAAFDSFDEQAVALWDRLLCAGRKVMPMGGSDAHVPEWIGSAWTAVPGSRVTVEAILRALRAGQGFASEAPLLDLRLSGHPPGATVPLPRGRVLRLSYRVADSAGLQCVRLVSAGRALKTLYPRDKTLACGEWSVRSKGRAYFRLEVRAVDNRRAFSAPVYVEPE